MRKMWLQIKKLVLARLTERARRRFVKLRDELMLTQIELGEMMAPERKEALRREVSRMMEDLDKIQDAQLIQDTRLWN